MYAMLTTIPLLAHFDNINILTRIIFSFSASNFFEDSHSFWHKTFQLQINSNLIPPYVTDISTFQYLNSYASGSTIRLVQNMQESVYYCYEKYNS